MGKRIPADIRCKNCVSYTEHVTSPLNKNEGSGFCINYYTFVNSHMQMPFCFKKKGGEG